MRSKPRVLCIEKETNWWSDMDKSYRLDHAKSMPIDKQFNGDQFV